MQGEPLGIEVLKQVASTLMSPDVIRKQERLNQWGEKCRVRTEIKKALQPWAKPKHYGESHPGRNPHHTAKTSLCRLLKGQV